VTKRAFDLTVAGLALLVCLPLLAMIALAVRIDTAGPVLHRSRRCGRGGEPFTLLKFRTMVVGAASMGPPVTAGGDPRITRVGRLLRATKFDELPQLFNVVRGDMSLVGPRPEDPRYVAGYTDEQRRILAHRPGLTSPATLAFRNEEDLLAKAGNVEAYYPDVVLPKKLAIDLEYFDRRTLRGDLRVLGRTLPALFERDSDGQAGHDR
jgi:lipopolysaccharide/colanic/teichoic acid biosynthesis glycosyltransferase